MNGLSRDVLWAMLGFPGGPAPAAGGAVLRTEQDGAIARETVRIDTARNSMPGLLFRPAAPGRHPAVLYCHAHGNRYETGCRELADGRPALQEPAYGPLLAERGFVALCIDMPGFGERRKDGSESALAKAASWHGRTLMGQMLAELSAGLDWLTAREDVDTKRIASFGISMGATHAYWLAALDRRIAAAAHLCAFSDIAGLILAGGHDLHGIYMTVPGLLDHGDMSDVAGMVAPRPQLIGAGAQDPLTPPQALQPALARLRASYAAAGAADKLAVMVSPDTGHAETPEMRKSVLDFLGRL